MLVSGTLSNVADALDALGLGGVAFVVRGLSTIVGLLGL